MFLAAPAQAAFPGANGKIAFDFADDIWAINPDGSDPVRITNQQTFERFDSSPYWSPDGGRIAFTVACSDEESCGGSADVFVMNADGSAQTNLTNSFNLGNVAESWSPDGSKILFTSRRSPPGIYVMNADGSSVTRLSDGGSPAWSPDAQKIALYRCPNFRCGLFLMNADGTGAVRITDDPRGLDGDATWSPDGQRFAFTRYIDIGGSLYRAEIFTMNADGTNQANITNDPINDDQYPAWSPDGRKIAWQKFDYSAGPDIQLSVMNADGSGKTVISDTHSYTNLDWQPLPTVSYAHPQSAPSIQASLVPTFRPCGTGANPTNGQHSPPLGTQACLPPTPGSNVARVGASSQGSASFTVVPGDTDPTNGDQADVTLAAQISDVTTPAGADYTPSASGPDLTEITRLRLTDKANNYGGASGSATEYDFRVSLQCAATADPSLGSSCSSSTSADTLLPGFITEQRQTVIQAFRVRLDDAGANGTTGDADDRIFATQGIYIP